MAAHLSPIGAVPAGGIMTQQGDSLHGQRMFEQLLAVSREAHANGQFEVAYHALTAAMHAATASGDASRLALVEREARAQIEWIDRQAPGHRLSTGSAGRRNHPGVYAMLVREAAAHAQMVKHGPTPIEPAAAPATPPTRKHK